MRISVLLCFPVSYLLYQWTFLFEQFFLCTSIDISLFLFSSMVIPAPWQLSSRPLCEPRERALSLARNHNPNQPPSPPRQDPTHHGEARSHVSGENHASSRQSDMEF